MIGTKFFTTGVEGYREAKGESQNKPCGTGTEVKALV